MDYLKIADIEAFFAPALKAHGFKTVDERDPESTFGALRTVENDELQVTFIIDRGHPYIDVQAAGTDLSLSLASIYHWLKGERPSADRRAMLKQLASLLSADYNKVIHATRDEGIEIEEQENHFRKEWLRKWQESSSSNASEDA